MTINIIKKLKNSPIANDLYKIKDRFFTINYKYYQPEYLSNKQWDQIDNGNIESFMKSHCKKYLDRTCVDRAIMIKTSMELNIPIKGNTLLDLGCSTGFFTHYFNRLGMITTGVDSNTHNSIKATTVDAKTSVIQTAKNLNKYYGLKAKFFENNIQDFLTKSEKYDVVLCLSLFHHFFEVNAGYGVKKTIDLDKLFKLIVSKTKNILYFEIDHRIADKFGWEESKLHDLLKLKGNFKKVNIIGISFDAHKKYRRIYECIK